MSTNVKVTKLIDKVGNQQQEFLQVNNSFVIFPYLASGYLDFTNQGVEQNQVNVNDYETFKRVWTGNDACVLNWKGSIEFIQNEDKSISTKFQLGQVLLGLLLNNQSENELTKDASFSDYTSQQSRNTLSFRISAKYFSLNENWNFYFYKIPEVSGSTLYRMLNFTPEYVGKKIVGYLLEFITINQDLANTGKAKQQNIMNSSPGQGYIEGQVFQVGEFSKGDLIEGKDFYELPDGRIIATNWNKMINDPVRKVVVKTFGPSIISNISFMGREVKKLSTFNDFGEPCLIFPIYIESATTPTIYRSQSAETNFYWMQDAVPTLQYWKDIFETIKNSMTPVNEFKYQGFLQYDYNQTIATNPKVGGSYNYSLFGYLKKNISTGSYDSLPWDIKTPISTKVTNMIYGCEGTYNAYGKNKKIWDLMFDSYWVQKKYITLPMNAQSHLGFGWTLGSALGSIVTGKYWATALLLGIGVIGSLVSKLSGPFYEGFSGIVSAPLIDLVADQYQVSTSPGDKIDFSIFDTSNKDSPSTAFFDGSTMNISFEANLTNQFYSDRIPGKTLKTENIGQVYFKDNTPIFPMTLTPLLLNGDARLTTNEDINGFIIDSFNLQAIFNGEFSIEFLNSNNKVVWNGVYLSEGKWSGSSREINSWKNTSVIGRENTFFGEPIPYPKPLPELISDLDKSYDFTKQYNIGFAYTTQNVFAYPTTNTRIGEILENSGAGYIVTWESVFPPAGIPRGARKLELHYTFDVQLLDTEFASLEEFWSKYEYLTFTYINLDSHDSGAYEGYSNYYISLTQANTAQMKWKDYLCYSYLTTINQFPFATWTQVGFGRLFSKVGQPDSTQNSSLEIKVVLKLVNKKIVLQTQLYVEDKNNPGLEETGQLWNYSANAKTAVWEPWDYWKQVIKLDSIFFKAK